MEFIKKILQKTNRSENNQESARFFSIKYRMFLSFGAVFLMTMASITVGWLVLNKSSNTFGSIIEQNVPEMVEVLELSLFANRLTAEAPMLITAETDQDLNDIWKILEKEVSEIDAIVAKGHAEQDEITSFLADKDQLLSVLTNLKSHISNSLALQGKLDASTLSLEKSAKQIELAIVPIIDDLNFELVIGAEDIDVTIEGAVGEFIEAGVLPVVAAMEIKAQSGNIAGLLASAANEQVAEKIGTLSERYVAAYASIQKSQAALSSLDGYDKLRDQLEVIKELGEGPENIFKLRRDYLKETEQAQAMLSATRGLSDKMTVGVEALVTEATVHMNKGSETAKADVAEGKTLLGIIAVISLVASLAISILYVGRSLVRRLVALSNTMAELSEGHLQIDINTNGTDEIASMAKTVRVFKEAAVEKEKLQEEAEAKRKLDEEARERRLNEEKERDAKAAEERENLERQAEAEKKEALKQIADNFQQKVGSVIEGVSQASRQMNENAEDMSRSAQHSTQQSEAVMMASENASANVSAVSAATEELSASIQEIKRRVMQSAEIAKKADKEAESTNVTVKGLAEAADRIGQVVSLISDIANQTNLLALNATIEAARAGEAGKGFAVVASEVKNLATQTAKATEEITVQIDGMQGATGNAVSAIESIGKTISEINEVASNIASSVEEQGAATDEIAKNVQLAAGGTSEVNSSIADVSEASAKTGKSATEVLSASSELTVQAGVLKEEVDTFLSEVRAM